MCHRVKLLLVAVNAKYIHTNLAVHSLKAFANRWNEKIQVVEYTINHQTEDILQSIYKEKADVVAFSCYIWNIEMVHELAKDLKKIAPQTKIWFGGPEVTYDGKIVLQKNKAVDGVMIGEGEQTFDELAEYYIEKSTALKDIKGIIYRSSAAHDNTEGEDQIIHTVPRPSMSMNDIPFPYDNMEMFEHKIIYYESSRGCPFRCSYCLSSIDQKVKFRDISLVKAELQVFLDHNVPQIKFVDRTFNANKKHAMDIWTYIKEHDNGVTNFHMEIAADLLTEEEMEFLKTLRKGQVQFEIGVQSTNLDTVSAIHRKMDLDVVFHNVNKIKEGKNIHQHLDLIAGLPLEGVESFRKSFAEVYQLAPDQLQLGFLKILKGSMMAEDVEKYGIVYRDSAPYEVLLTNDLSYEEVIVLKGVCEMVEIYYNSGQFTYTMEYLNHFYENPMDLYLALSEFYEKNGYGMMAHGRIRKYEIVLEFYQSVVMKDKKAQDDLQAFQEILTLDLCSREDMKAKPQFVHDDMEYKLKREWMEKYQVSYKKARVQEFKYDVFTIVKLGKLVKKSLLIIFDYENKDPLSQSAKQIVIEGGLE